MNNVADKLYNILGIKFNNTDIKTLDSKGKETTDMEEIEMFSFDFLVDSKNYGPVVILLSANENLEVYYGDNTSKSLNRPAKKKWENLIEHLSTFARTNRLGFSLKHTSDLKYDLSNIADITESFRNIFEGYYGTKKTSYNKQGKAKIIIKHTRALGEDEKRFRNISSLFIENADGERFKLPFKKLAGARAMARHVTEGGNPYDLFGVHISEMVNDINTLGGFVRRSKMYEGNDDAMNMVETGRTHYNSLRKGLKQIAGVRGYNTYKESWEPSEITEQDTDTSTIRGMFMDKKVNQRTEDALPLLARLQQMAEAQDLDEKAPPGMEDWIMSNKAGFIDQYGKDKGLEVLYATAWKRHNSNEGVEEAQELIELAIPEYRGFKIKFSKVPGKKLAARATSKSGAFVAGAYGKNEAQATEALKIEIDDYISGLQRVTGKANINLNAEFAVNHLKPGEDQIWAKLIPGPKLIVAGDQSLRNEETLPGYLRGEHFTKTGNRKPMASETGTDLLGFGINPANAAASQAIANGRYTVADVAQDQNGDVVYELDFDSVVINTNEKIMLGVPGLTVATARGIGEDSMETNKTNKTNKPTEVEMYNKIKGWNISALKGYARRIGLMSHYQINHDADEEMMIDEIMGFLYDDNWERVVMSTGSFNETQVTEGYDDQRDDAIIDFLRANKDRGEFDTLTLARVARQAGHTISAGKLAVVLAKLEQEGRVIGTGKTVGLGSGNFTYDNWTVPNEMQEANEFEQWADNIVSESNSMNVQEELTQWMDTEQPVGIDALNATTALRDIIDVDDLFDELKTLAATDPDADARPVVKNFIETLYKDLDEYGEEDQAEIVALYRAVGEDSVYPHEVEEDCNDLDYDGNATQLNANHNKHMDDHINESVDLKALLQLTNHLLKK